MAPRINRLERITNLVLALLETSRPLSLREIGTAVAGYPPQAGALRQAFERDKRTLRDGGIPIAVERVDGEEQSGYRIRPEDYYLADLDLTEEEAEALGFALAAVRLEGSSAGDVASKLGAHAAGEMAPFAVLPSVPALGVLQQAIRDRALARFTYHGRPREVAGYGLVFREGSWYLVGREEAAGAMRTFRVDRIEGEAVLGERDAYTLPEGLDAAAELRFSPFVAGAEEEGATEVTLEVDVRVARAVRQMIGEASRVAEGPDGSVVLSFKVGDDEALLSYVLGLGDAALVREPPDFAARVVSALEAAASRGGPVPR